MELSSGAIPAGSSIDLRHAEPGIGGGNISPDLAWTPGPEGTRSYAVSCHDPDAPLPKNLGLVSVARGNSDDLLPGDPLAVIGFPGLGGSTVTFTDGVVAGFLDEDEDGVYEWIKTDTEMNPGNSGGLAIDQQGAFIGVPSAGYSRADVAGKISLIRPSTLALDYYDRAVLGQSGTESSGSKTSATTRPSSTTTAAAGSVFGRITFAADVTDDNRPVDTGNAFVDVGAVYAFFSVTGVTFASRIGSQAPAAMTVAATQPTRTTRTAAR